MSSVYCPVSLTVSGSLTNRTSGSADTLTRATRFTDTRTPECLIDAERHISVRESGSVNPNEIMRPSNRIVFFDNERESCLYNKRLNARIGNYLWETGTMESLVYPLQLGVVSLRDAEEHPRTSLSAPQSLVGLHSIPDDLLRCWTLAVPHRSPGAWGPSAGTGPLNRLTPRSSFYSMNSAPTDQTPSLSPLTARCHRTSLEYVGAQF